MPGMLEDMGREEMRASDADRQVVADGLKDALEEGRLDLHEYDERLQRAYAAKTYGDLERLLTDLPASAPVPVQRAAAVPAATVPTHVTREWLWHLWSSWITATAITSAIWLVSNMSSGALVYFWPVWVAGPWGLVLIWQTIGGLATGAPQRRQAEIEKAERKKQLKRERKALEAEKIARGELPPKPEKQKKKAE